MPERRWKLCLYLGLLDLKILAHRNDSNFVRRWNAYIGSYIIYDLPKKRELINLRP